MSPNIDTEIADPGEKPSVALKTDGPLEKTGGILVQASETERTEKTTENDGRKSDDDSHDDSQDSHNSQVQGTVTELPFEDQSSRMPLRKLLMVYLGIGFALMVAFMDQTAVSTATPVIATSLNASKTISWIGTSFFVGNCSFQLVYGRISDIFGRKNTLQAAIALLAIGDLLCSFAQTPIELYVFRALGGVGCGGVTNLAMVIVSDIVPLRERGTYQGFISAACSLGTAIGPFVGGGLATTDHWRWLFRTITIAAVCVMVAIHLIVPLKPVGGGAAMMHKIKMIDGAGIVLSSVATVAFLIPVSGGGSIFAWSSGKSIALFVTGAICLIGFVLAEAYSARLPILPLRLFRLWTPSVVMITSFLIGVSYFGSTYYVPIYMQYVKGYSPLVSGSLVLAYTLPQSLWGICAGFFVSKTNRYKLVIVVGCCFWTLGSGLQMLWSQTTSLGEVIGFLEINAIGIGFNLQTTLVAALATTRNEDRAVVTGSRNYFRTMGAAFGLAAANTIYQHELSGQLAVISSISPQQRQNLTDAAIDELKVLTPDVHYAVRGAYAHALRLVFLLFTVVTGTCTLVSLLIKEIPFRKDTPELEAERRANGR